MLITIRVCFIKRYFSTRHATKVRKIQISPKIQENTGKKKNIGKYRNTKKYRNLQEIQEWWEHCQLRQLWSVRKSLSDATARILVHALIISRVDYCNSILHRVAEVHIRPLQLVMNAAARLITRKRRFDHITATLRDELHWLPVRQRIEFKLCLLVFKCLRQVAPLYLTSMCVTLASGPMSHLRSAAHGDLLVPRCRTAGYGPRSFAVAGPACWNNLPLELKTLPLTSEQFVSRLKTVLFRRSY